MPDDISKLRTITVARRDQLRIVLEQTTTEMAFAKDRRERSRLLFESAELLAQLRMLATVLLDVDGLTPPSSTALAA